MVKISRPTPKDVCLRHRLFERLDHLRRFPVIWISAPAGSGKTTLISSYIENRKIPYLWYQLDSADTDIATFFYYLREAVKKALPRKRLSLPLFTPEYLQGASTFVLRFFERLYAGLTIPFILVFDNFQEISLSADQEQELFKVLSIIPEGVNVLTISRNELPASFSRLKTNRSIGILGWEDIRLTEKESKEIINLGSGIPPVKKDLRSLYKLSDGWAAGLILLYEGCRKGAPIPEFAGKRIFDEVYEYLATEIFRHLDAKTQEFFLTTAFLARMTVHMAEQLTGNQAAGNILSSMNRNNFFITRHDGAKAIYEYHPLCRHFLRRRAREIFPPEKLFSIRRRAALILEKAGMTEAAVVLLKDIADWEAMAEIIASHASDMLKQGRHRTLLSWLKGLPDEVMKKDRWLVFWEGMSLFPGDPALAEPVFKKVFILFQESYDTVGSMLAASGIINSIIHQYNDLSQLDTWYSILKDLAVKMDEFQDEKTEALIIASLLAAGVLSEKSAYELKNWEERALKIKETQPNINVKAMALRWIFYRRLLWGGCREALPFLHELQRFSRLPEAHPVLSIIARSAEVRYYLCNGRHEDLVESAQKGLSISNETGIHMEDVWFCIYTAASFINRMNEEGAREWLERMPSMDEDHRRWAKVIYHLQLLRIALIRKEHVEALDEGRKALDIATSTGSQIATATSQLMLAQVFLLKGERKQALNMLEQARSNPAMKHHTGGIISILKLDAQFAFDEGDDSRGLLLVRKSLSLAREYGHSFTFLDDPNMTRTLCEKALEAGIEVEQAREIIRRCGLAMEQSSLHIIENWPWPLKIYTLGRFSIIKDGAPLKFAGKVQQMPLRMLKLLISLGGREIAEVAITEALWPDADGDQAHQSFESNLHRLRKLLGHTEVLRLCDGKITIDGRYCWVDVWAFERLAVQANDYEQNGKVEKAWEFVEKALALYEYDFLSGDSHERWVVSPSERLKAKYFKKLLYLGHSLESAGHFERAAHHYERGLEVDDRVEEIYQRLMVCYSRIGKRGEAMATYDRCRRVLASSLGIEPSDETRDIRMSIFSQQRFLRIVKENTIPGPKTN
jgi:LuxR family transcriptional regulator, maltose regulon positive regulatory protein